MWVFEKLVQKDVAAQAGVGDPAVFLGVGDAVEEEAVVAEAVAAGIGPEAFEAQMNARAADAKSHLTLDDEFAALFGDYATPAPVKPETATASDLAPPRLFQDTFAYATAMIERLSRPEEEVFENAPTIAREERLIKLTIPDDMKARDGFGYATEGAVDGRYMPEEAVGPGDRIELTDQAQVINRGIEVARMQERSWPTTQYLWDNHPILEWFSDRASTFFPEHSAPVALLSGRLLADEVAVVLHGAIPNGNGAPVVDRWAVVSIMPGKKPQIEEIPNFLGRTRLAGDTPNRAPENLTLAQQAVPTAVDFFQTHLVELRRVRNAEVQRELDTVLVRLAALESRFKAQLTLDLGVSTETNGVMNPVEKRRLTLRLAKEQQIERLFRDWTEWFERTRRMVDDPNPHVDVKAVFLG